MLTFDPVPHEYKWSGRRVPSVTQLLQHLVDFGMVSPEVLEAAQFRGSYVHDLVHADIENDLVDPEAELAGQYGGYLRAARSFIREFGAETIGAEERGFSERFGYAGQLDWRGRLPHKFGPRKWVIDWKTSKTKHKVWGLQTAAYRQILAEQDAAWLMASRATVQLFEDGRFQFSEWNNPLDWPAFQSLVTLVSWNGQNE